jgi:hypothetical protein
MKVENFGVDWLDIDLPFKCEIHHCYPRRVPAKFSVLLHSGEPRPLKWSNEEVLKHHKSFDLILTNEKELLQLENSRFFILGDTWVTDYPSAKIFGTSFLYSAGCGLNLKGYNLRKEIWDSQNNISTPNDFWLSSQRRPIVINNDHKLYPHKTKAPLFNSMFSICIENVAEENYFTEKLIDAIRTFTIPLYWGCPNIEEFFNVDGLITFNNKSELLDILNGLSVEDYWQRMEAALINLGKTNSYIRPVNRIADLILYSHNEINK